MKKSPLLQRVPFYFVRHGETDWNAEGKFHGQTDIALNQTGREQAEITAKNLIPFGIALICYSPLLRAKETAFIIGKSLFTPLLEMDHLEERFCGSGEGKLKSGNFDLAKSTPSEYFIGAEPYEEYVARFIQGMNEALKMKGPVCIISHGGVFWSLCLHLNIPPQELSNASIIHFVPQRDTWSLIAK
ncbi:MAG: histidine phosphatase family protein [Parachlamydiaceae bacterium]|nr:histidine phosphatase family protein [Parachlamydiaceae bacterium]